MNNTAFETQASINTGSNSFLQETPQPGFFSNFDWKIWLLIIFVFAFLGFNIFSYLAQGTQTITNIMKPITALFAKLFVGTTKEVINVAATGTQAGVTAVSNVANTGLTTVENATDNNSNTNMMSGPGAETNNADSLNAALNKATTSPPDQIPGDKPTYEADDSYSTIQSSKSSGKSGWCYIGEDRGFRSCIKVGENDQCMSGDIFPTEDVCVNPNLRA